MANYGRFPDSELVMIAWIASIPEFTADWVDHELPWDLNVPVENGYVQVTPIGGVPSQDVPLFMSTAQVDCYVNAPSEDRSFRLWAKDIAMQIKMACYDREHVGRAVTPVEQGPEGLLVTYPVCRVYDVYCLTDGHYIESKDNYNFEGWSMDFAITWTFNQQTN
jgi:hypothetical protein